MAPEFITVLIFMGVIAPLQILNLVLLWRLSSHVKGTG